MHEDIDFNKELKVAVVAGDNSGPYYHDFGVPIPAFHALTGLKFSAFPELKPDLMYEFNIIHFQRQYAPESLILLRNFREKGIATIALVDDNIWELPRTNPAFTTYQGTTLELYQKIISEAHAVTTSTPYLKQLIGRFNERCYIFRNLVDPKIEEFLSPGRDDPSEIRIGWTATPHHYEDAKYAMPALKELCRKYPKVKLVFMGWLPTEIQNSTAPFEFYEFVPVDAFYPCLANLDLDIGIAPLADNPFNWGKTARKMQEYAILRVPAVVSPVRPYDEWKHNETCLKPYRNKQSEWVTELSKLIVDLDLRKRLTDAAHAQVLENHNLYTHIYERAAVYYDVYSKVQNGEI